MLLTKFVCRIRPPRLQAVALLRPGYSNLLCNMSSIRELSSPIGSPPPTKRAKLDVTEEPTGVHHIAEAPVDYFVEKQRDEHKSKKPKRSRVKRQDIEPYSHEDVLWHDVKAVLGSEAVETATSQDKDWESPLPFGTELELTVSGLTSTGDSISVHNSSEGPWAVVVPFALPGEKIRTKIYRSSRLHSFGDLLEVAEANSTMRDSSLIRCKYFGKCAGCQHQVCATVRLRKAFENFSGIPGDSIPAPLATIPSPKQYNYRTKITPHFDAPPSNRTRRGGKAKVAAKNADASWELRIGFNQMGRRNVLDIEVGESLVLGRGSRTKSVTRITVLDTGVPDCHPGSEHRACPSTRRGATLLLRDSLEPRSSPCDDGARVQNEVPLSIAKHKDDQGAEHICITDSKAVVYERVGEFEFTFPAGQFFQNNNSVLKPLTDYVRDAILHPIPFEKEGAVASQPPTHLVDTYCGSGLFSITLSPHFEVIAGIEISADSIAFAQRNAELNNIPTSKCTFRAGTASSIFASVGNGEFPPERTAVVIDPPRKGCDEPFIEQLVAFLPATLVHTQARDVGSILRKTQGAAVGRRYRIESIRGFDLFPQTAHVESVAVLRLY
ncbi:tRNA methyltransferase [Rhizoctonia solani AG-1 IA]|uniref:tRNA methyltransferase n=1 Tax=Thanatephorus cucumeris (strain AG1-IA) TaxID=983506 RepID=L8WZF2_THACA|nr:tRNA methyltransferase [Rhizoctonia solani AG-1 IA]